MHWSRREFLGAATIAMAAPRWLAARQPVHVAVIYCDEFIDTVRGALIGIEEARKTAALLRRDLGHSLVHVRTLNAQSLANATAVVTACPKPPNLPANLTVIDAANAADAAQIVCRPNVWHIAPLTRHQRLALEAYAAQKKPDGSATTSRTAAWHPALERFGAGQLNARFVAAGIQQPGAAEWAGWMAAKCLWESGLRSRGLDDMSFDGHKGRRLYFGARSRNLIQPIYIVGEKDVLFEWNPPENVEDVACGAS